VPALDRYGGLLRTAGSLMGTTIATSVLGAAYWWLAARLLPEATVGYGSAAISAMSLIGTVGMLGLGTMLIGELEGGRKSEPGLITASLLTASVASLVLAVGVTAFMAAGHREPFASGSWPMIAFFVVGSAVTGGSLVLDLALIGLATGYLQLLRNTVFAAAKLALLFAVTPIWPGGHGLAVVAAWVAGLAVSMAVIGPRLWGRPLELRARPDWPAFRRRRRATAAHNMFNVAGQLPRLTLPILATALISARAGAAFYVVWLIMWFFYLIPNHLSTSLFAIGAGRENELRHQLNFSLRLSLAAGLVGCPLLIAAAHDILRIFGDGYAAQATSAMRLLALAYLPMIVKTHYISVIRVQQRLARGSVIATIGALLEIGAAAAGAEAAGITGLATGVLVALVFEVVIMWTVVWRAATRPDVPDTPDVPNAVEA